MSDMNEPVAAPDASTPKEAPPFIGSSSMFGFFVGYFPFLYGLIPLIGLLEGTAGTGELALGCVSLGVGVYGIAWEQKRNRRSKRLRAAIDAAIPDEDRIAEGEVLPTLARAFSGTVLPAAQRDLVDSLRAPARAPEDYERVGFTRDDVELVIYRKTFDAYPGEFDDRGPGMIPRMGYWRVQARVPNEKMAFRVSPREQKEPFSFRWDPAPEQPRPRTFTDRFLVSGTGPSALPEEVRALLRQRTAFVVRCQHGRLECMWPETVVGVTRSRFEDAVSIVATTARHLRTREAERDNTDAPPSQQAGDSPDRTG
ncbi:hypothetical protein [Corallococcus sp. RDP092CA]|uniref:hypothetical protein n=1 Tax=Corallococcus sp. RDP092CA TaxID=3109369 RepID=UPI0035B1F5D6